MLWQEEEWLTKNPERISPSQISINNYLKNAKNLYQGKKMLHIGIGNSSIFKELSDVFGQIDGVTNMHQELERAGKYRVYLINKYNLDELSKIDSDYDVIVDVSLKSYACCNEHWLGFMKAVINKLKIGGRLISHTGGFGGHASPNFDNSTNIAEIYQLLGTNCFLFEIKHRSDENGCYPFIIEKT